MANQWQPKTAYAQKLRDPRWQKMRLNVMERDNFTCRECASKDKTLNVHHCFYYSHKQVDPWEYPVGSLITLCEDCHESEVDAKWSKNLMINQLSSYGFRSKHFMGIGFSLSQWFDGVNLDADVLAAVIDGALLALSDKLHEEAIKNGKN